MGDVDDDDAATSWWGDTFGDRKSVDLNSVFIPELVKIIERKNPSSIPKQVAKPVLCLFLKFCLLEPKATTITLSDFILFHTRFGPLDHVIQKALSCFFDVSIDAIYPWFHGTISRSTAEQILMNGQDGSFLLRFSESQPEKFTLTYLKIHSNGKKEFKNCLLLNAHEVRTMTLYRS